MAAANATVNLDVNWYILRHRIKYLFNLGYLICAGILYTILHSELGYYTSSQSSSWYIVYYPRVCFGIFWLKFGTMAKIRANVAP